MKQLEPMEITAALIVAARHRAEWSEVVARLEQGETFLTPGALDPPVLDGAVTVP